MGVGPSIAEGSQGCRPNWAIFWLWLAQDPVEVKLELSIWSIKIC